MNPPATPEPRTLIDDLLAEQQSLTAVERFARKHERNALPAQSRYYRQLIPLDRPRPGEQYAFGVDLDSCTGCKACVSACHSLNGLDEDEIWRNVGLIHGGTIDTPYQQTVTTACHHCVEPGCLEGCPVRAYDKDASTGIVRHLDDQCIGCQYCVLKCPYDVPKYSPKRGIVRKCDMCHSRLAANEAPACVQACPTGAITIRIVSKAEVAALAAPGTRLLPGAHDSHYTAPTTAYTARRPMPANTAPADAHALRLEPAHWPLVGMLIFTQLAAGLSVVASILAVANPATFQAVQGALALAVFVTLHLGLGISVLHLGRPLGAWRAFLGLRTSWMSREIFAFGGFAGAGSALVLCSLWDIAASRVPALQAIGSLLQPARFTLPLVHVTAALALLGVYCSAMIYIDTHRAFWRRQLTFTKFFGTTFLLGSAAAAALLAGAQPAAAAACAIAATIMRAALFGWEFQQLRHALADPHDPIHRSALLMWRRQRPLVCSRAILFAAASALGLLALGSDGLTAAILATLAFGSTALSQLIERYTFFTAVIALRMPGPPAPANP